MTVVDDGQASRERQDNDAGQYRGFMLHALMSDLIAALKMIYGQLARKFLGLSAAATVSLSGCEVNGCAEMRNTRR